MNPYYPFLNQFSSASALVGDTYKWQQFFLQYSPVNYGSTKLNMLVARYAHVIPVDPSLAPFFVHENNVQGYIEVAMLTLVLYNACWVVDFHQRHDPRQQLIATFYSNDIGQRGSLQTWVDIGQS